MQLEAVQVRRVIDRDDPAIEAFGRLQVETFPEPELLIPPDVLPYMIHRITGERRNYLIVAEYQGNVIGGAVFHYFPHVNTGFSSFLATAKEWRGVGLARKIHAARFALLDADAGSTAPTHGLFIDVVAPERLTPLEQERERLVGADPVGRRRAFHKLGFRRVAIDYYQPPDRAGGEPVTVMDLLFCPRTHVEAIPTQWVVETMRAYWAPWLGREAADSHAAELERRCGGETVALLPAYAQAPSPSAHP